MDGNSFCCCALSMQYVSLCCSGAFSGHLSDRWQCRKPFVLIGGENIVETADSVYSVSNCCVCMYSALVMALCSGGLFTWIRTYSVAVGLGCILGERLMS